jgi:hypothetical protein
MRISTRLLHKQAAPAFWRDVAVDQLAGARRKEIRAIITILAVLRRRLIVNCGLRNLRCASGPVRYHRRQWRRPGNDQSGAPTDSESFRGVHLAVPWHECAQMVERQKRSPSLAATTFALINANTRPSHFIQTKENDVAGSIAKNYAKHVRTIFYSSDSFFRRWAGSPVRPCRPGPSHKYKRFAFRPARPIRCRQSAAIPGIKSNECI